MDSIIGIFRHIEPYEKDYPIITHSTITASL
jgi:hypothetical protein